MTYLTNKVSGFKTAILKGMVPDVASTSVHFKYDSSEIPNNFGVTSSDNHIFNFSQGSSYFVFASNSFYYSSRSSRNFSFGFKNTDNNSIIGKKGQITSGRSVSDGYRLNPQYTKFCSLHIEESQIPSGGLNIGVKLIEGIESWDAAMSGLNSSTYKWDVTSGTSGYGMPYETFAYPTMTIFKTNN